MSSIRVKKVQAPLAYVPVQQGQVVVVPTDKLPSPVHQGSPINHEFLVEHARELAGASSASAHSAPRSERAASIPPSTTRLSTTRRHSKTLGTLESGETSALTNTQFTSPASSRQRRSRSGSGSWFVDHVANSSTGPLSGGAALHKSASQAPPAPLAQERPSTASNATLEVIIPEDVRAGLVGTLQNRNSSFPSLASEMHRDDIVDHLSVIDAHIATVSHLSNAANSILIPPLSFYSRKPIIPMPATTLVTNTSSIKDDRHALDQHVEDVLDRRDKFRRTMQGLWAYLKTPVGIITGFYGFLVVFWGSAIVLFLAKWINLHNPYLQGFWVEISAQIVNALFTVQGVGFLPWRIMDTWNIGWIYYFKRRTCRLRSQAQLPPLADENDIPDPLVHSAIEFQVLGDRELRKLRYHQAKFMHSQTWYRPHGTETHRAFSIELALWICIFVDLNSVFQILLCACMWGFNRFQRPAWTMGSLIPLSFICGILAGILIWRGGEMSKRTEEVEARLRGALEDERRSLLERDDRAGLSIDSARDDGLAQEKQIAHTAVRDSSSGFRDTSSDANRERDIGLEDKLGDGGQELVSEAPTVQTSLKAIHVGASTSDVLEDRLSSGQTERLHESSQRVSGTGHPPYDHEVYEKV